MALGDCISPPCGSPLEFESILIRLFAKNSSGCVGVKILTANVEREAVDANLCDTKLSLQQLIQRSIVDDGNGGYALRVVYVSGDANCIPCGVSADVDTVLRSLFFTHGECYGIKVAVGAGGCNGIESYNVCGAIPTVEQLIKNLVVNNETYGNYIHINQLAEDCSVTVPCDLKLTFQQIIGGLINKVTAQCYGLLNLNAIAQIQDEELKECGDYITFEQALMSALTVVDCGFALNVYLVGAPT